MWRDAADAYADRSAQSVSLHEDDEEIDILHDRLTGEIAAETMPTAIGAQVTLIGPVLRTTRRSCRQSCSPNRDVARLRLDEAGCRVLPATGAGRGTLLFGLPRARRGSFDDIEEAASVLRATSGVKHAS